jgi:hypothetical protein
MEWRRLDQLIQPSPSTFAFSLIAFHDDSPAGKWRINPAVLSSGIPVLIKLPCMRVC